MDASLGSFVLTDASLPGDWGGLATILVFPSRYELVPGKGTGGSGTLRMLQGFADGKPGTDGALFAIDSGPLFDRMSLRNGILAWQDGLVQLALVRPSQTEMIICERAA